MNPQTLSSGAIVRVERINKSFFLILGELGYYWLDNKGNYYSEDTFNTLCRTYSYEVIDPGHRVYSCQQTTRALGTPEGADSTQRYVKENK